MYATARRESDIQDLAEAGIQTLELDVRDPERHEIVVRRVVDERGGIDLLVNNAGYGLSGPAEEIGISAVRDQFETNVIGSLRLTQHVLPTMRAQQRGTIVNLSSIFGRFAVPGGGAYAASKHAIEAFSDALRLEVGKFGIRVVVVEPGPVQTAFGDTYLKNLSGNNDAYQAFRRETDKYYRAVYEEGGGNFAGRFTLSPEAVARVIERASMSRRPRARYAVGTLARSVITMRRLLSDPAFDWFVRKQFPAP